MGYLLNFIYSFINISIFTLESASSSLNISGYSIYVFINTWNQYLWPLLTINNGNNRTVQIGISMLQYSEGSNYSVVLAGAILILIPSVFIFLLGQKQLVKGMTAGAVKG